MSALPSKWPAEWLVPQWPAPAQVRAVCTTRSGGVSRPPYESLNLGTHVGDDPLAVQTNRQRLLDAIGVRPVFLDQVHGNVVVPVDHSAADGSQADGAWTVHSGVACTVMVADCLPVLLTDTRGSFVAALHAGWRGLAGTGAMGGDGVLEAFFKQKKPVAPAGQAQAATEIIAWLGPAIGPDAFEVGDEVRQAFVSHSVAAQNFFRPHGPGKWLADLAGLARLRLAALGVTSVFGNDSTPLWCTYGQRLRFFSHRRDGVSGRFCASIWRA